MEKVERQMREDMRRGKGIKITVYFWGCGIPRDEKKIHECGLVYPQIDSEHGIEGGQVPWYGLEEIGVAIKRLLTEQNIQLKPKTKGDSAVFGLKRCGKYGK